MLAHGRESEKQGQACVFPSSPPPVASINVAISFYRSLLSMCLSFHENKSAGESGAPTGRGRGTKVCEVSRRMRDRDQFR